MKGSQLRDGLISGANNITNRRQQVDALNVFPVPDGDTGTNMSMTISAARRELELVEDHATVGEVARVAAAALLRGARGNSGVILSLLFRGFSKGLAGKEVASPADIVQAYQMGVESAYKAVMKPTEGTVLTVSRRSAERAAELVQQQDVTDCQLWEEIVSAAGEALADTPNLLPVLKKAGVVDAGGQGFLYVLEGILSVVRDGTVIACAEEEGKKTSVADLVFEDDMDGEITFTYCTEFIVNKAPGCDDAVKLRAYLESIGDSAVVVDDEDIIKCHVHTDNPGDALQAALQFGALTHIKIDNMREQYERRSQAARNAERSRNQEGFAYQPVDPETPYGFVAVAAGDGVKSLFTDLGAQNVVSGGQTMNPSTEDILSAIHATPAKTVFVLPNNKNIIMAAEQAINLADRQVCVLPTRTIPQGLSAMLAFDPDADVRVNQLNMTKAFERVGTGQITFAARDSEFDGHTIKKDELLALENGKLAFAERNLEKAVLRLTRSLVKRDTSFVTLIYGEDVSEEEAQAIQKAVAAKLPDDVECALIAGGQPIYYFIISAE